MVGTTKLDVTFSRSINARNSSGSNFDMMTSVPPSTIVSTEPSVGAL
jgi:hypothetical protein